MPVDGVVDGERHHLARAHFGSLPPNALIEKSDDETIEFQIVVSHPEPVRLDGGLLQIEPNPRAPELLITLQKLDFMLAHQALDLFRGEPFRRSLLHHSPGLIDEPMRSFYVREGSPFGRFSFRGLQRPDDLSLKPSRLLVEEGC